MHFQLRFLHSAIVQNKVVPVVLLKDQQQVGVELKLHFSELLLID